MAEHCRQPPPRTWWDGYGYVYQEVPGPDFYGWVGTNGDTGGQHGLPEDAIELRPVGDEDSALDILRDLLAGADDHRCWHVPHEIAARARALLELSGEGEGGE